VKNTVKRRGILLLLLLLLVLFLHGCNSIPTEGPTLKPDFLVFKTVELNFSDYWWGSLSADENKWFYGSGEYPNLDETTKPLPEGYTYKYAHFHPKIAFFHEAFRESGWRKIPEDENLKKEREKLIIKEPFTELFICKSEMIFGDKTLDSFEATQNHAFTIVSKIIKNGALSQKCEKKI